MNISEQIKLEVGRMLQEGVSEAGIKVCVEAMENCPVFGVSDYMGDYLHYAAFTEYGKRSDTNVVEGTVVYPVTDETRLLPQQGGPPK